MTNSKTLRRLRIYVPRITRMMLGKRLKHYCCYMHIPKSGGSSVHEALRAIVPLNQHIGAIDAISTRKAAGVEFAGKNDITTIHEDGPRCAELFKLREVQLMTYMAQEMALIYGHFLFSKKADDFFGEPYKFITILRDPVTRVISNYRSARFEEFILSDLDSYLDSDVARRHAQVNLRYFSGIAEIPEENCLKALKRAKENMDKFSVIGFIDKLDVFCKQFKAQFGVKPIIHHYNLAKGDGISPTPQQLKKIERLCQYDIELYKFAYDKHFK